MRTMRTTYVQELAPTTWESAPTTWESAPAWESAPTTWSQRQRRGGRPPVANCGCRCVRAPISVP